MTKRLKNAMSIQILLYYITLFTLWFVLSDHFEFFFIISGIISCLFTIFLCQRLNCNILGKSNGLFFSRFITYIGWLGFQVILSCFYIARKVWQVDLLLSSETVLIESQQKNDVSLTLFANSVTLTPGTISVDVISVDPYKIIISVIDKELIDSLNKVDYRVAQLFYSKN